MKFFVSLIIVILIILSCKKSDNTDNNENEVVYYYGTFQQIFDKAFNYNFAYHKLKPFELYSSFISENDSISLKVKSFLSFINSTINISEHPDYNELQPFKSTFKNLNFLKTNEDTIKYIEDCPTISEGNITYCTYSWERNNGKLKVKLTQWNYPDNYKLFLNYDGIDIDNNIYKDENIQFWTIKKDLTSCEYIYYSKFFNCDEKTNILFHVNWWIENNEGQLCFVGSNCNLSITRCLSLIAYTCDNGIHHPYFQNKLISYPNNDVIYYYYKYSSNKKSLYLWIYYKWFEQDKRWCTVIFDENGNIIENECGL